MVRLITDRAVLWIYTYDGSIRSGTPNEVSRKASVDTRFDHYRGLQCPNHGPERKSVVQQDATGVLEGPCSIHGAKFVKVFLQEDSRIQALGQAAAGLNKLACANCRGRPAGPG